MKVLTKTVLGCSGDVVLHHFPSSIFDSPSSGHPFQPLATHVAPGPFGALDSAVATWWMTTLRLGRFHQFEVTSIQSICAGLPFLSELVQHCYGIPEMSCRWFPSTAYLNHSCQGQVCQDQFKTRRNHFAIRCTAKPPWRCEDAIFRLN